ncbi:hypothetical protein I546_4201 [Mycobacterium kansasii 732]|nr:hypothetical protein I546_4201 [Mycobacterium kansasii 732]
MGMERDRLRRAGLSPGFMRLGGVGSREPFEAPGATSEDPVATVEQEHIDG